MELKFIRTAIKSVDQGIEFARKLMDKRYQNWIFRGQRCAKWTLSSGLERMITESFLKHASDKENEILKEFQRQGHQYVSNPPALEDYLEWLALLQHHHGPTRLIDFTESFHVAMFFALVDAFEGTQDSAIWCVNMDAIAPAGYYPFIATDKKILKKFKSFLDNYSKELVRQNLNLDSESDILQLLYSRQNYWTTSKFVYFILQNPNESVDAIIPVSPFRLSERMAVQKSVFLLPINASASFEKNLMSTYLSTAASSGLNFAKNAKKKDMAKLLNFNKAALRDQVAIIKLELTKDLHYECWQDLKGMNITRASLFPGIDGFAASIKDKISWDYRQLMR